MEFNQRIILNKKLYFSSDHRYSNTTVRGSLVKFLFSSCVLYLLVNTLIYSASPESITLCYISVVLMLIGFCITIYYWKKWKLGVDPKIGKKYDNKNLEHVGIIEGFDMQVLVDLYEHPLTRIFPSPLPKHQRSQQQINSTPNIIVSPSTDTIRMPEEQQE